MSGTDRKIQRRKQKFVDELTELCHKHGIRIMSGDSYYAELMNNRSINKGGKYIMDIHGDLWWQEV